MSSVESPPGSDEAPDVSPRETARRIVVAPAIRTGRILWRVLPWFGASVAIFLVTWLLGTHVEGLRQIGVGCIALLAYGILTALLTEILSPDRADLRLLPFPDAQARRLAAALKFLFFFLLVTEYGAWLLETNDWHAEMASVLRIIRNVVLILATWAILSALGLFRWMSSGKLKTFWGTLGRFAVRILVPLGLLTALFMVIATELGYVPLARYVAANSAWTALKLAIAVLTYKWLRNRLYSTVHFYRADDTAEGDKGEESESKSSGLEADPVALGVEQIGGGVLLLLISIGTLLWILADWDLSPAALWGLLGQPIAGGEGLTWGQMLGGFAKIFVVILLGWLLKSILTFFVFPKSKIGVGARYAILAVLRYAVIALVAVFALAALGIDTSSLGWFFGAAGVGIGFGLQDIIGNFISGLIMLIERPIRVGDNVQIGEAVGKVHIPRSTRRAVCGCSPRRPATPHGRASRPSLFQCPSRHP